MIRLNFRRVKGGGRKMFSLAMPNDRMPRPFSTLEYALHDLQQKVDSMAM